MKERLLLLLFSATILLAQTSPGGSTSNLLPGQKIGVDDLVSISVFDSPEFSLNVRVDREGQIRMPMLKRRVYAQGLFPSELEVEVARALKEEELLNDPYVTVNVVEYMSRPISIAGAVRKPVTFQAVGEITLLEALTRAEGLAPTAGTEILLTKPQPGKDGAMMFTQRISVKGLIDEGRPELNVPLLGGEQIRVPEAGKVFVVGNVKKPGAFQYGDQSEMTLLTALAQAEGLTEFSSKQAYIYRKDDLGAKTEIEIELEQIMKRRAPDVPLAVEDIVYIPDDTGARKRSVALKAMLGMGTVAVGGLVWALAR